MFEVEEAMKSPTREFEGDVGKNLARIFCENPDSVSRKLTNFPKYVRREDLRRFMALYEMFKLVLPVKGSVVECGVYRGFSLMTWAKLSSILEPENSMRRVYGFDTFEGFPAVHDRDQSEFKAADVGELRSNSHEELLALIRESDTDRALGVVPKVELIRGDIVRTIPEFVERHQHLVVSLLFLDCDLYEPTKVALEHLVPRMPKGAVLGFDELDKPIWPGETAALLETKGIRGLRLRRLEWEPYVSYAVLE